MKTLAICIISHERPHYLRSALASLSNLHAYKDRLSIFVFDNSINYQRRVQELCLEFEAALQQSPGASQQQNFAKVSSLPKHKYCMLLHDDDFLHIKDAELFLADLESFAGKVICYLPTLYLCSDLSMPVKMYNKIFNPPISDCVAPWDAPAFPSWIYRVDEVFLNLLTEIIQASPAGKYSDVIFIDRLLSCMVRTEPSFKVVKIDHALYIYRFHVEQDSSDFDVRSYAKMLFLLNRAHGYRLSLPYALDYFKRIIGRYIRMAIRRIGQ